MLAKKSFLARFLQIAVSCVFIQFLVLALPALAVSPPSITPGTGSYLLQQSVSMSAAAGSIYYTLDGSTPDVNSTQYSAPIAVTQPTQIKAVAYSGGTYSSVTTAYLDVDESLVPVLQPTGLTLRLCSGFGVETDSGTTPPVNTWVDLSGNNNSATGSSSTRPTLESNAINGLPALNFNSSQYLTLPSGFANFTSGASLFIVTSPSQLTANSTIFDLGTGATGNNIKSQIAASGSYGQFSAYNGTSGTSVQSAAALTQSRYQLLEAVQSPGTPNGTATFWVNAAAGTPNSSMNNFPNITRTNNYIGQASGTGNIYNGKIVEILLYTSPLSASQRVALEAYLMQKYQVISQVPATPLLSLGTSTLIAPAQVVISADPDAVTRYTLDGTTPNGSSTVYTGLPFLISYSQTLKAVSFKNGLQSSVASATYTLDANRWPAPNASDTSTPTINLQSPTTAQ